MLITENIETRLKNTFLENVYYTKNKQPSHSALIGDTESRPVGRLRRHTAADHAARVLLNATVGPIRDLAGRLRWAPQHLRHCAGSGPNPVRERIHLKLSKMLHTLSTVVEARAPVKGVSHFVGYSSGYNFSQS